MTRSAQIKVRRKLSNLENRAQAGARLLDQYNRVFSDPSTHSFRFNVLDNKIPFFDDDLPEEVLSQLNNVCDFFKMAGIETTISDWGLSGFTLKCVPGGHFKTAEENYKAADDLLSKREQRFVDNTVRGISLGR